MLNEYFNEKLIQYCFNEQIIYQIVNLDFNIFDKFTHFLLEDILCIL
jgi:hypothetical protein